MVLYFGQHSCKIFIIGKQIRFGYKNLVICSDNGYPFKIIPYQSKLDGKKDGPLGLKVVKEQPGVIADARKHDVYFDNFFTSMLLFEELKNMSFPATGTIRSNRTADLKRSKLM